MKKVILLLICTLVATCAWADSLDSTLRKNEITVPIWPNGAPHDNGVDYSGTVETRTTYKPQLHVFLPKSKKPTKAVIVLPGGGYAYLAAWQEGYEWRPFLNREKVACIVLTYRMPHGNELVPIEDVYEAIRIIKKHATEWKIDTTAIGVMGFSAGGHLASTVATHAPADLRPAFQILFYPVISFENMYTLKERKTRECMIGSNPTEEKMKLYSNELQVTKDTPRTFMIAADNDSSAWIDHSICFYTALKEHNIPAELHIYPKGGHGYGARDTFPYHEDLLRNLKEFLRSIKP